MKKINCSVSTFLPHPMRFIFENGPSEGSMKSETPETSKIETADTEQNNRREEVRKKYEDDLPLEDRISIPKDCQEQLKNYGVSIVGRTLIIEGISSLKFDDNTKDVSVSMNNKKEVKILIENKKGAADVILVSKNSFKLNGTEFKVGGKTVAEIRDEKEKLESNAREEVQLLIKKYESKGWVSQGEKANEISVSVRGVRGRDPLFRLANNYFSCINYPGSFGPMTSVEFDEFIRTTPHKND